MIPVTSAVSNAIVDYNMNMKDSIRIGDIPTDYTDPDEFAADVRECIEKNISFYKYKLENKAKRYEQKSEQEGSKPEHTLMISNELQKDLFADSFEENLLTEPIKRGRGRPRKQQNYENTEISYRI